MHRPAAVLMVVAVLSTWAATATGREEAEARILHRRPNQRVNGVGANAIATLPTPSCSSQEISAFACLMDDTYPTDFVERIVERHRPLVEQLHAHLYRRDVEGLILRENNTQSYRHKGNFACESDVAWAKLGWARDVDGRFLLVVNTQRFRQIVRLESCRYPDKQCEYLPPCYKSTCRQRYSHVHVIVVDAALADAATPFVELIATPSSCSCFVENFTYV